MMQLPSRISAAILDYIKMPGLRWKTARSYKKQLNILRVQLQELSNDFARGRPTESTYSDAYLAYNFPANYMKIRYVMQQLQVFVPDLFKEDRIRVLDIGCGEGAGLLGILHSLPESNNAVFHGLDASQDMVKKCHYLMRTIIDIEPRPRIRIQQKDVADGLLKTKVKYDIILLSNSLIELTSQTCLAHRYIERISKNLSARGIVIVMEPALLTTSQRLMEIRCKVVAKHKLKVLLPCLHEEACPLSDLRDGKEWCHQSICWRAPEYLHVINQGLNREISVLKFSYLVLSSGKYTLPAGYTVISSLLREKGKKRCYLCSPEGRIEVVRLNKQSSPINQSFDRISKGDVIILEEVAHKRPDYWQINERTKICILSQKNSS